MSKIDNGKVKVGPTSQAFNDEIVVWSVSVVHTCTYTDAYIHI